MIATISKEFAFSASHQLSGLPEHHPCSRLHGHNYLVRVELEGPVNEIGFVVDYGELRGFANWIDEWVDHKHLNDVFTINPTAEHLAREMLLVARKVLAPLHLRLVDIGVSVSETPKTWATVVEKW